MQTTINNLIEAAKFEVRSQKNYVIKNVIKHLQVDSYNYQNNLENCIDRLSNVGNKFCTNCNQIMNSNNVRCWTPG